MSESSSMKLIIATDFDGVFVPRQISRGPVSKPFSSALNGTEYITTKLPDKQKYCEEMETAHKRRTNFPDSYSHEELAIDVFNSLAHALDGLYKNDVVNSMIQFWKKPGFKPNNILIKILKEAKKYGSLAIVTGSPTIYIQSYNDTILEELGIKADYVLGTDLMETDDGKFTADETETIDTPYGQKEIVKMKRKMFIPEEKLNALLDISPSGLNDTIGLGDTLLDKPFLSKCGYPCMVVPDSALCSAEDTKDWGMLFFTNDYIPKFLKMLDFVYSVPSLTEFDVNGYSIKLSRKIVNRYDRRIALEIQQKGWFSLSRRPKNAEIPADIKYSEYIKFAGNHSYDRTLSETIWTKISEFRERSMMK